MSRLESAALAYVRARDAYCAACNRYRAHVGREDLECRTPEEQAWFDAHVLPLMVASWPIEREFLAVARQAMALQDEQPFGTIPAPAECAEGR